jgi:hypothetical protein
MRDFEIMPISYDDSTPIPYGIDVFCSPQHESGGTPRHERKLARISKRLGAKNLLKELL